MEIFPTIKGVITFSTAELNFAIQEYHPFYSSIAGNWNIWFTIRQETELIPEDFGRNINFCRFLTRYSDNDYTKKKITLLEKRKHWMHTDINKDIPAAG